MLKKLFTISTIVLLMIGCSSPEPGIILPIPSDKPNEAQLKQINRKYGMFIHFGINTFHDMEWTDGSKDPKTYAPTQIDAEQWIKGAKDAGMKYVILVSKHHEGFCLWDSKYTTYDVASSSNPTNVIEEVAKACKKYDIGLGIYYSLWDRHENPEVKDPSKDADYNKYIVGQLNEIIDIAKPYTHIVEFWFDGSWTKQNYRWPLNDMYQAIKSKEPECQIAVNWNIGYPDNVDHSVHPHEQQEGFPIRYFPSDFRIGDPQMPADNDPKLFTYNGNKYYMPWESTICLSRRWFYHTDDQEYKPMDKLVEWYKQCTKNDNILIINCPPNREGRMRTKDLELLKELRQELGI